METAFDRCVGALQTLRDERRRFYSPEGDALRARVNETWDALMESTTLLELLDNPRYDLFRLVRDVANNVNDRRTLNRMMGGRLDALEERIHRALPEAALTGADDAARVRLFQCITDPKHQWILMDWFDPALDAPLEAQGTPTAKACQACMIEARNRYLHMDLWYWTSVENICRKVTYALAHGLSPWATDRHGMTLLEHFESVPMLEPVVDVLRAAMRERALAFAMADHARLGERAPALGHDMLAQIVAVLL